MKFHRPRTSADTQSTAQTLWDVPGSVADPGAMQALWWDVQITLPFRVRILSFRRLNFTVCRTGFCIDGHAVPLTPSQIDHIFEPTFVEDYFNSVYLRD